MRSTAVSLLLCLAFGQATAGASNEETLTRLEREWSAAFLRHDTRAIERILADEYVGIDGRGVVSDKTAELREAKAPAAPSSDWVVVDEALSDFKVRTYGTVGVVTSLNTETVRVEGEERTVRFRRTTVYVRRAGRWQCVSFHASRVIE